MALSALFIDFYGLDFYRVQFDEDCTVTVAKNGNVGTASSEQGEYLTALTACEEIGLSTSPGPTPPSGYTGPTATPTDMLLAHIQASDPHDYLDLIRREAGRRTEQLRRWRAALGARSTSAPATWVAVGDSVTEGAYGAPIEAVRAKLASYNGGKVSPGWVNGSTSTYALHPYRFTLSTGAAGGSEGANNYNLSVGLANYSYKLAVGSVLTLQELTPGLTLQNSSPHMTEIEFYWTKSNNPGAQLEFRVGGTLVYTADCHDAGLTSTDSGYSYKHTLSDPHSYAVTVTAVGAPAVFDGAYIANGDTVRIYNAGHAGAVFADVTKTSHYQFLAKLTPDLISQGMGLNDYGAGATAYGAMYRSYYDGVAAALSASPPSWLFAVPYKALSRTDWSDYVTAALNVLAGLDLPAVDMNRSIGDVSGADPLALGVDDIHLTAAGGDLYAQTLIEALGETPATVGLPSGSSAGGVFSVTHGLGKWVFEPDVIDSSALNFYADKSLAHPTMAIGSFFGSVLAKFGSGAAAPACAALLNVADGSITLDGGAWVKTLSSTKTANYTLALADLGTRVIMNSGTAKTITVPLQASVVWPDDSQMEIVNRGAGTLTLACSGTLLGTTSLAQGASVKLVRLASDVWQAG